MKLSSFYLLFIFSFIVISQSSMSSFVSPKKVNCNDRLKRIIMLDKHDDFVRLMAPNEYSKLSNHAFKGKGLFIEDNFWKALKEYIFMPIKEIKEYFKNKHNGHKEIADFQNDIEKVFLGYKFYKEDFKSLKSFILNELITKRKFLPLIDVPMESNTSSKSVVFIYPNVDGINDIVSLLSITDPNRVAQNTVLTYEKSIISLDQVLSKDLFNVNLVQRYQNSKKGFELITHYSLEKLKKFFEENIDLNTDVIHFVLGNGPLDDISEKIVALFDANFFKQSIVIHNRRSEKKYSTSTNNGWSIDTVSENELLLLGKKAEIFIRDDKTIKVNNGKRKARYINYY